MIQTMLTEPRQRTEIKRTKGVHLVPTHTGHIDCRIGIVLTDKDGDTELILVIVRHLDALDHGTDHVHVIIGKTDNALRTGTHAGTATTATGRVGQGGSFFIISRAPNGHSSVQRLHWVQR